VSEKTIEYSTRANSEFTDGDARRAWAEQQIKWGLWELPEAQLGMLGDVAGLELLLVHPPRLGPQMARRGDLVGAESGNLSFRRRSLSQSTAS
jgi:hypothetical protein